jgi:hypothetical protein
MGAVARSHLSWSTHVFERLRECPVTNEFRTSVKIEFDERAASSLPTFNPISVNVDERIIWLGRSQISNWVSTFVLVGGRVGQDAFAIEIAWNDCPDYPWVAKTLSRKEIETLIAHNKILPSSGRLRLEKLWGAASEFWWSEEPKSNSSELLASLADEIDPCAKLNLPDSRKQTVPKRLTPPAALVEDAVERILKYGIPFLESLRFFEAASPSDRTIEFRKYLRNEMGLVAPGFQELVEPSDDPIEIMCFRCEICSDLRFWIVAVKSRRHNGFAIELAWSRGNEFPRALPSLHPLDNGGQYKSEVTSSDFGARVRLSQLWSGERGFWWMDKAFSSIDEKNATIQEAIKDVGEKIRAFGTPFFSAVASAQGVGRRWEAIMRGAHAHGKET